MNTRLAGLERMDDDETDRALRAETVCRGCGQCKNGPDWPANYPALVVCWKCFKYPPPAARWQPLQQFAGTLREWLTHMDCTRGQIRRYDEPRPAPLPASTVRGNSYDYDYCRSDADPGL